MHFPGEITEQMLRGLFGAKDWMLCKQLFFFALSWTRPPEVWEEKVGSMISACVLH